MTVLLTRRGVSGRDTESFEARVSGSVCNPMGYARTRVDLCETEEFDKHQKWRTEYRNPCGKRKHARRASRTIAKSPIIAVSPYGEVA